MLTLAGGLGETERLPDPSRDLRIADVLFSAFNFANEAAVAEDGGGGGGGS